MFHTLTVKSGRLSRLGGYEELLCPTRRSINLFGRKLKLTGLCYNLLDAKLPFPLFQYHQALLEAPASGARRCSGQSDLPYDGLFCPRSPLPSFVLTFSCIFTPRYTRVHNSIFLPFPSLYLSPCLSVSFSLGTRQRSDSEISTDFFILLLRKRLEGS